MRGITQRTQLISKAHEMMGRVAYNNCFPTLKGLLLYVQDEKCFFEILPVEQIERK